MARTFDGPLTKDDLEFLRARYSQEYTDRLVEIHGMAKGKKGGSSASGGDGGGNPAESPGGAGDGSQSPEDDLIGAVGYDPTDKTEAEVKEWADSASDEAKAGALALEQARTDREPRKGVVSLLS